MVQLAEIWFAPFAAAVCIAVSMSSEFEEFASTSRMWQLGQIADTVSRSSEISWSQPALTVEGGVEPPFSLSLRKQPLLVVQGARL